MLLCLLGISSNLHAHWHNVTPPEQEWNKLCGIFWKAAISPDRNRLLLRTLIPSHLGGLCGCFHYHFVFVMTKGGAHRCRPQTILHFHSSCCFHQEQLKARWSCCLLNCYTFIPVPSLNSIETINRITIIVSVVPGTQTVILAGGSKQWFHLIKMKNKTRIERWKRECWIARYRRHTTGVAVPNIVTQYCRY